MWIASMLVVAQWLADLNWREQWRRLPSRYTFWIIETWSWCWNHHGSRRRRRRKRCRGHHGRGWCVNNRRYHQLLWRHRRYEHRLGSTRRRRRRRRWHTVEWLWFGLLIERCVLEFGFVQTHIINDEICDTNEKAETANTQLNRLKETFRLRFGEEPERFETVERRVERLSKIITE